ncbi:hypothetical protein K9N50_06320, partial [bacterium]|nr:hypothetical protein [bacterium]
QPEICDADSTKEVIEAVRIRKGIDKIEKCLVFCPDAIGFHVNREFPELIKEVAAITDLTVPLSSVYPPKTPVCFTSMFTGAMPEVHGIREYVKPVLGCDTLFDALVRANKKVAILAIENSSLELIFREREINYFAGESDQHVTEKCIELLKQNELDFIVAYQQQYDDTLHQLNHYCSEAQDAIKNHVQAFKEIMAAWNEHWINYNRLLIFAPDHGAHFDKDLGHSNHGDDIPEDMQVLHYYKFESRGN